MSRNVVQWQNVLLRLGLSALYVTVIYFLLFGLVGLMAVQWARYLMGWPQLERLVTFIAYLSGFILDAGRYVLLLTDQKPFPFNTVVPVESEVFAPQAAAEHTASTATETPVGTPSDQVADAEDVDMQPSEVDVHQAQKPAPTLVHDSVAQRKVHRQTGK